MIKNRYYSAYNDFKTGILYKIFLIIGFIFLFIFILLILISKISDINNSIGILKYLYDLSISNFPDILISFSIILISIGLILYFFKRQFEKLAEIADEIEKNY
jgi:hypothetical protein